MLPVEGSKGNWVIDGTAKVIDHPDYVAERIVGIVTLVGMENSIGCGDSAARHLFDLCPYGFTTAVTADN